MSIKDLTILAKFYFFKNLNEEQTRKKLNEFCYNHNPEYNEIIFGNKIDQAIKTAKKNKLYIPENIIITNSEIDKIKKIGDYRLEKILFALLICAKYQNQSTKKWREKKNKPNDSSRFFVNKTFSPVISLAKVHASYKEQLIIGEKLKKEGYIVFNDLRGDNDGSFEIFYADTEYNDDNIFAEITSRDDIIDFYPPYLICLGCGKEIEKDHNSRKYCVDCWKEKKKATDRAYIKKTYKKKKLS